MIPDLVLNPNYKNVAVKLSGGADSAIVYYAVCNYYKNTETNVYALTMYTPLKPWYSVGSAKVIDIVEELTGVHPVEHFIHYHPAHTTIRKGEEYSIGITDMDDLAIKRFNFDAMYSGLTINPPTDIMIQYFIKNYEKFGLDLDKLLMHINKRNSSRDTTEADTFVIQPYEDRSIDRIRPFIDKNKKEVYKAYVAYDMMEKLYPYTYSCEEHTDSHNNMDFVHCGHCFFCLERYWGFGRII